MFPNQMTALARHYDEQRHQPSRHVVPPRPRGGAGALRKRTGWTLVHLGLRMATSASR